MAETTIDWSEKERTRPVELAGDTEISLENPTRERLRLELRVAAEEPAATTWPENLRWSGQEAPPRLRPGGRMTVVIQVQFPEYVAAWRARPGDLDAAP